MGILLTLLSSAPYIRLPNGAVVWFTWFTLLSLILWLIYYWRNYNKPLDRKQAGLFVILALAVLLTNLFLGLRSRSGYPLPGIPIDLQGPAAMLFGSIPWMLGAGLLGLIPAAILAFLSGLLSAFWDNHDPYFPLQLALMAIIFSAAICQRYRTLPFHLLRQPILASILLSLIFPLLYLLFTPFSIPGILVDGLDYSIASLPNAWLVMTIELFVGSVLAQGAAMRWPTRWAGQGPLTPSPTERSLETRFLYSLAPLGFLLLLAMLVGSWIVATRAAREMLRSQMATTAALAAEQIPHFLASGENLITDLGSDPRLTTPSPINPGDTLGELIKLVPYFDELLLIDSQGNLIAAYPETDKLNSVLQFDEKTAITFAFSGLPVQYTAIPAANNMNAAQVSFIAPIFNSQGSVNGVLVGRAGLNENPTTKALVSSLLSLSNVKGQGIIMDRDGRILVHTDLDMLMTEYNGIRSDQTNFDDEIGPDGKRRIVYYQPIPGDSWGVALIIPASIAQQFALQLVLPLMGMLIILLILAIVVLHFGLRVVTGTLKDLASEGDAISAGRLEEKTIEPREDEVGLLQRAFSRIRLNQKTRFDEMNRLLAISRGVASNLEIQDAVSPILESALAYGASSVRIILAPEIISGTQGNNTAPACFSLGPTKDLYSDLDGQILDLTRQQDRLVLTSLTRPRLLEISPRRPYPASLIALALRHEKVYFGALWVAFDQVHHFSEEEVHYLATLASHAALAVANTHLYMNAETGRQHLAAVLASSPDPILVTDKQGCVILTNPAAWHLFGLGFDPERGQPVDRVVTHPKLLDLIREQTGEKRTVEITFPQDQVYLASITSVITDGELAGRVCVLRNVTRYKEQDSLKSEFVVTVSHDLRSPLSLMRGYATMIEMVGQLNEQQSSFMKKILASVDIMSRLVNNLLDLGRIESGLGLKLEMISPGEIVEQVIGEMQTQAEQKKIQISTEKPTQIPMIEADGMLIHQALQNYIDNAIKFTSNEGKVTICIQAEKERIIISVKDTGIGISPMDQARIFDRFYRGVQKSPGDLHGSGLGLAIVKSITESHGGQVWVESQLGKGSAFYMAFPLHQEKIIRQ